MRRWLPSAFDSSEGAGVTQRARFESPVGGSGARRAAEGGSRAHGAAAEGAARGAHARRRARRLARRAHGAGLAVALSARRAPAVFTKRAPLAAVHLLSTAVRSAIVPAAIMATSIAR